MAPIRIAVVSDLHVFERKEGASAPSYVATGTPDHPASGSPFSSARELANEQELRADILVCCGDMGDKASPSALIYAWKEVHALAAALGAQTIAATVGNHDMDSRHTSNVDAKGNLLGLAPPFPTPDEALNNQYWARNFCQIPNNLCRLFVLNSAAYHGYQDEYQHGRISDRTLSELTLQIKRTDRTRPGILVCHHHPQGYGDVDTEDRSEMKGGPRLLEALSKHGNWLVIHGHRHYPRIAYGPGGADAPTIFSAGSFSAVLYPDLTTRTRNQFYILELEPGQAMRGTFRAWDWAANVGWIPSSQPSMPARGGFGCKKNTAELSLSILRLLATPSPSGRPSWDWSELAAQSPELRHVLPSDDIVLLDLLREGGAKILEDKAAGERQIQLGSGSQSA